MVVAYVMLANYRICKRLHEGIKDLSGFAANVINAHSDDLCVSAGQECESVKMLQFDYNFDRS